MVRRNEDDRWEGTSGERVIDVALEAGLHGPLESRVSENPRCGRVPICLGKERYLARTSAYTIDTACLRPEGWKVLSTAVGAHTTVNYASINGME